MPNDKKGLNVRAEHSEGEGIRLRAEWEEEMKKELSDPPFSLTTKIVIWSIVGLGVLNLALNFLTLGPDIFHW